MAREVQERSSDVFLFANLKLHLIKALILRDEEADTERLVNVTEVLM